MVKSFSYKKLTIFVLLVNLALNNIGFIYADETNETPSPSGSKGDDKSISQNNVVISSSGWKEKNKNESPSNVIISNNRDEEDKSESSSNVESTDADKCRTNFAFLDSHTVKHTNAEINQCNAEAAVSCTTARNSKFRTLDGSCNNLRNPTWGKSYICYRRILPHDYGNGMWYPRLSTTGNMLPNPRSVSIAFHKQYELIYEPFTTFFMEWGQVIAHDVTLNEVHRTKESGYNALADCCTNGPVYNQTCISSPTPPEDEFYLRLNHTCLNWVRTLTCNCQVAGQRFHSNKNTAYLDLSLIYGSTSETALSLRSMKKGMLIVETNTVSGPLPPTAAEIQNCVSTDGENGCYRTGDERTNQNPFLLMDHVLFLRHHNYICNELAKINPHWNDERLYQEARRINIAIYQYITYDKYLKHILGEMAHEAGLSVLSGVECTKYDPNCDATISDEFSVFAQRYGHTLIPGNLTEINIYLKYGEGKTLRLRDNFYKPNAFKFGEFDKIAKGMTVDHEMKHDQFLGDDVRNYLFRRVNLHEPAGDDLAAVSIMRGRDHGIPGAIYYHKHLLNMTVKNFDDLKPLISQKNIEILKNIYECVHDIDVYVTGFAEKHVSGGIVGPTFAAVLVDQYKRLKHGDRYYFEHGKQPGSFTKEQLIQIKRSSPARMLCDVTNIKSIQPDVFYPPSQKNPVIKCQLIPNMNFLAWKENKAVGKFWKKF